MVYKIGTRDYLTRARKRLDENIPDSLFYVALELRFGIEARLKKYLDIIDELPKKFRKGWKIAELGKNVESVFKQGNKLVKLEFYNENDNVLLAELFYTPVSKRLIKDGEKIGDMLHSTKHYKTQNENWFLETKRFLEVVYSELELANKGTLLGPPLRHPQLNKFELFIEYFEGYDPQEIHKRVGGEGAKIIMNLSYLDKL